MGVFDFLDPLRQSMGIQPGGNQDIAKVGAPLLQQGLQGLLNPGGAPGMFGGGGQGGQGNKGGLASTPPAAKGFDPQVSAAAIQRLGSPSPFSASGQPSVGAPGAAAGAAAGPAQPRRIYGAGPFTAS